MTNHFCHVLYDYPCDMDQGVENSESQPEFGSYDRRSQGAMVTP